MAKTAQEKTPAQLKVLDIRNKLEKAREADEKASTEKTKATVTALTAELKVAVTAENRERFVRVGGSRVKKARQALRNLSAVASPRSYEYSEEDVAKAEKAIMDEAKTAIGKLRSALVKGGGGAAKEADDFTF